MEKLSVQEVEYEAFKLAREIMSFAEPIPDFSTRFPNILESCLATPFQSFSGKTFYSGIISKAAILFYLMIKNHPFQNGNKRIAVTTLLYFLYKNGKWIKVDAKELYEFAMWVTNSNSRFKKEIVTVVEKFIKFHIVDR
ncbi:MAG: type II toxin-antitoxin system death-on-curing family toxin [Elusimicrobiota bacterium]